MQIISEFFLHIPNIFCTFAANLKEEVFFIQIFPRKYIILNYAIRITETRAYAD